MATRSKNTLRSKIRKLFDDTPFLFRVFPLLTRPDPNVLYATLEDLSSYLRKSSAQLDAVLKPSYISATNKEKLWLKDHGWSFPHTSVTLVNLSDTFSHFGKLLLKENITIDVAKGFVKQGITLPDEEIARMYEQGYIADDPIHNACELPKRKSSRAISEEKYYTIETRTRRGTSKREVLPAVESDTPCHAPSRQSTRRTSTQSKQENTKEPDAVSDMSPSDGSLFKPEEVPVKRRGRPRKYSSDSSDDEASEENRTDFEELGSETEIIPKRARKAAPTVQEQLNLHSQGLFYINHEVLELNRKRLEMGPPQRDFHGISLKPYIQKFQITLKQPLARSLCPVPLLPGQYQDIIPDIYFSSSNN